MHLARGVGVGAGLGAVLAGFGEPWAGAGLIAMAGALAVWRAPDCAALARRTDALGGLADAVTCAWDHRNRCEPIDAAQARVALRHATALDLEALVPRPSVVWGLGLLLWAWPALQPASAPRGGGAGRPGDAGMDAFRSAQSPDPAGARPSASGLVDPVGPSDERLQTGKASPSAPEGTEPPGGGKSTGEGQASGENGLTAGIGAKPGELPGGGVRPVAAPEAVGEPGRVLTAPRGVGGLAVTGEGPAALGRSPSTRDDVLTDPARPFPEADAPLIAAYFDRRTVRRRASPTSQAPGREN